MAVVKVGEFALVEGFGGRFAPDVMQVTKVTEKQIEALPKGWQRTRRLSRGAVMASFPDYDSAKDAADKIGGIKGEMDRRILAAKSAAQVSLGNLLRRLDKAQWSAA